MGELLWRDKLMQEGSFIRLLELVPGRGQESERMLALAHKAYAAGEIDVFSVTDNPNGAAALSALAFSAELRHSGLSALTHMALRDRNRHQLTAELYALRRAGDSDILLLGGDYPAAGFEGRAKPVFDLDVPQALQLVRQLNRDKSAGGGQLFAGVAVNPYKLQAAELLPQYHKLNLKLAAGARFVIAQAGYSARKLDELYRYVAAGDYAATPLLACVFLLPYGVARRFAALEFPGCVATEELLAALHAEAAGRDKGRAARLRRAALLYAVAKGIGYRGVQLGGIYRDYEEIQQVLEEGERGAAQWRAAAEELSFWPRQAFYYYTRAEQGGLNSAQPAVPPAERGTGGLGYRCSLAVHWLLFRPGRGLFPLARRLLKQLDGRRGARALYHIEHFFKRLLYDCKDCGDCALPDCAYLCPMSRCPKQQRNGPCGGSYDGWCELWPGQRRCLHSRVYRRLQRRGGYASRRYVPPTEWAFYQNSAWLPYFLGRDHAAKQGITERVGLKDE